MTLVVQIANRLVSDLALLNLRTRRLLADVQAVYGCSKHTAIDAIVMARRWAAAPHRARGGES